MNTPTPPSPALDIPNLAQIADIAAEAATTFVPPNEHRLWGSLCVHKSKGSYEDDAPYRQAFARSCIEQAHAKVRELPGKWRASEAWMSDDNSFQTGRKGQLKLCVEEIEAALASLNVAEVKGEERQKEDKITPGTSRYTSVREMQIAGHQKELAEKDAEIARLTQKVAVLQERNNNQFNDFQKIEALLNLPKHPRELTAPIFAAIGTLHSELAAAQERLAALEWRPVSVKPTREDADVNGWVLLTDGERTTHHHIPYDFPHGFTHWRSAALPPQPTAEDKQRAEFEAWVLSDQANQFSLMRSTEGNYLTDQTHSAWMGWQAAQKTTP